MKVQPLVLPPTVPRGGGGEAIRCMVAAHGFLPGIRPTAKDTHSNGHRAVFVRTDKGPLVSGTSTSEYYTLINKRQVQSHLGRGVILRLFYQMDPHTLRPLNWDPLVTLGLDRGTYLHFFDHSLEF